MVARLPRGGRGLEPRTLLVVGWGIATALATAYALAFDTDCASFGAIVSMCGPVRAILLCLTIAAVPVVALALAARPLSVAIALYAAIVPLEDVAGATASGTVAKSIGAACAAMIVLVLLAERGKVGSGASRVALASWCGLAILCAASLAWAVDPGPGVHEVATLVQLVALYALLARAPIDRTGLLIVLGGTALGGALVGGYSAVLALHGHGALVNGRLYLAPEGLADPNQVAAALLLPVAILTGAVVFAPTMRLRMAAAAGLLAALAGVLLSGSRGAILALGAMAVVFALRTRRLRNLLAILAVAVVAIVVVPNGLAHRFSGAGIETGAGRVDVWQVGLAAFGRHWLTGAGYGAFPAAYDAAFFQAYQPYFADWHRAPHSLFVSTAVELGVLGIVVMAIAWIAQLREVRAVAATSSAYPLRLTLECAVVGLLVAAVFLDIMTRKYTWLAFAELSLLAAIVRREQEESSG